MEQRAENRIVIVGGGAGGLELVVKLAKKFKRNDTVNVTLIDKNPTHIWKPLLHEIATGSLNGNHDETSYRMLARKYHFSFVLGSVELIDNESEFIRLSKITNQEGATMVDERLVEFDTLVVSVGSVCNDFGTPGVLDHCLLLDTRQQAERFHSKFISHLHRINAIPNTESQGNDALSLIIVGAGATGVELAADLHNVTDQLPSYGFDTFSRENLKIQLIEAGPFILPALPQRVSDSVHTELTKLGVEVLTNTRVSDIDQNVVSMADGRKLESHLTVWAAGIQAPKFLAASGFPVDNIGRIKVSQNLLVEGEHCIFSIGDCCACEMPDGSTVPPRAQSAHQMANHAYKNIVKHVKNKPMSNFVYKDLGSLISLSKFSTIGNLMGNLMRGTVFIEGWLARLFYLSLYRMHQLTVHGFRATALIIMSDRLYKATRADIKLH